MSAYATVADELFDGIRDFAVRIDWRCRNAPDDYKAEIMLSYETYNAFELRCREIFLNIPAMEKTRDFNYMGIKFKIHQIEEDESTNMAICYLPNNKVIIKKL